MARSDDHDDQPDGVAGPLLPPEDRLWRHPSELGPPGPPQPPATPPAPGAPRWHRPVALTAVCVLGLVAVAGIGWAARPAGVTQRETAASGEITTYVLGVEVASIADPAATEGLTARRPAPRAQLGIQVVDVPPDVAHLLGSAAGAQVVEVAPGGPADSVTLQPGDVIVAVDGHPIADAATLVLAIRAHQPGARTTLDVRRGHQDLRLTVTLGG